MADEPIFSYRTLQEPSQGLYVEKRSKFISHALPVESEEEAMLWVEEMRKRYYDARHVCWAYRVGKKERTERANDDGEPSSTAGKPILGQIHSYNLTNLLIVVIRYFGGVKLGTSGLIVAYRTAAEEAIKAGTIEEHTLYTHYRLRFPYSLINPVMMLLRAENAETLQGDSDTEGYLWDIRVADQHAPSFLQATTSLYQLQVELLPTPL